MGAKVIKQFKFIEQQSCDNKNILDQIVAEKKITLSNEVSFPSTPSHLAINPNLEASFYIGADWLVTNEVSAIVLPKIKNIDYIEMFLCALSVDSNKESNYFSHCYHIDFEEPVISVPKELNQLAPLLLIHYITLLKKLIRVGLKKDYIIVEENLKSKVKGHILIGEHLRRNVIPCRNDRFFCRYQQYTTNIPVNRLLKKALIFANQMLMSLSLSHHYANLQNQINHLLTYFEDVSCDVSISEIKQCSGNKLYKHYNNAVMVAKNILRRYDYSLSNISSENNSVPPFWIDMSRLFEMYVYSKLNETYPGQIKFQVPGYRKTAVDYIFIPKVGERPLIIDAKYKPRYEYTNRGILPDIEEICRYGRDLRILKTFGLNLEKGNEEIGCIIIYPSKIFEDISDYNESSNTDVNELEELKKDTYLSKRESLWENAQKLSFFRNFGKLNIDIPMIKR